jgi:hypothetical protein
MGEDQCHAAGSIGPSPLWVDGVDKVGDEQGADNNRIQVPRFLNQCCASDSYLGSMLLTRPSKNVYRHHRSKADITEAIGVGLLWRCQQTSARQSRAFRAHPSRRVVLVPDLLLTVRMVRRRSGCSTIKRLNTAWLGNTAAMMHYLRIINSRGSQYR